MSATPGTYEVDPLASGAAQLKTSRIGFTSFDVSAPVASGTLVVGLAESTLRIELALDRLRTRNPLMQGAARALVSSGDGEVLVFAATGPGAQDDLVFTGDAQAGDVIVPMTLTASVRDGDDGPLLDLVGSAEFHDVHIPLPGMSGVRTITCDVNAALSVARGE